MSDEVDIPGELSADKLKAAIAKMAKAPKTKVPEMAAELAKAHQAVHWDLFDIDKLETSAELEARAALIAKEVSGPIGKLTDQARAVEKEIAAFVKAAGKEIPKDLAAILQKAQAAPKGYISEVESVGNAAQAEVKAKIAKAKIAEKKAQAPSGPPKVESKATKLVRQRGLETLRKVRKPQPNAKPLRFMVVEFKKVVRVFMGPSAGPAQEKLLRSLLPNEKPIKIHKDPTSEVIWEKNALTLVSDRIPSGLAKKIQVALKMQLKMSLKVRMRKTSGEAEEADDPDAKDLTDDMLKGDPADAKDKKDVVAALKDIVTRLAKLQPDIDKALKAYGPDDQKALNELVKSVRDNGKSQNVDEAASDLDDLEAMLDETPSGDSGDDDAAELAELHDAWVSVKSDALRDIKAVATAVVKLYRTGGGELPPGLGEAVKKLNVCMGEFQNDLDSQLAALAAIKDANVRAQKAAPARATVKKLLKFIETNEIMRELDDNEVLKVKVSGPVKKVLQSVDAALA